MSEFNFFDSNTPSRAGGHSQGMLGRTTSSAAPLPQDGNRVFGSLTDAVFPFSPTPVPFNNYMGSSVWDARQHECLAEIRSIKEQIATIGEMITNTSREVARIGDIIDVSKKTLPAPTVSSIGIAAYAGIKFSELNRELDEYKNAIFWDKKDWMQYSKDASGVTVLISDESTSNSAYAYCTDANGQLVSENELDEARECCRTVFGTIDGDPDGVPPATWARCATLAQQNYLRMELETRFPWLKLCSHGWKAKQLAIDLLPSYRQSHPVARALKVPHSDGTPKVPTTSLSPPKTIPARRSAAVDDLVSVSQQPAAKRTRLIRARNPLANISYEQAEADEAESSTVIPTHADVQHEAADTVSACTEHQSSEIDTILPPRMVSEGIEGSEHLESPLPSQISHIDDDQPQNIATTPSPNTVIMSQAASDGDANPRPLPPPTDTTPMPPTQNVPSTHTTNNLSKKDKPLQYAALPPVTPKTLCGLDWLRDNPNGTEDAFNKYYRSLPSAMRKEYEKKARAKKAADKKAAAATSASTSTAETSVHSDHGAGEDLHV